MPVLESTGTGITFLQKKRSFELSWKGSVTCLLYSFLIGQVLPSNHSHYLFLFQSFGCWCSKRVIGAIKASWTSEVLINKATKGAWKLEIVKARFTVSSKNILTNFFKWISCQLQAALLLVEYTPIQDHWQTGIRVWFIPFNSSGMFYKLETWHSGCCNKTEKHSASH